MKKVLITAAIVFTLLCIVHADDLFESRCFYSLSDVFPVKADNGVLYAGNYGYQYIYSLDISNNNSIALLDSIFIDLWATTMYAYEGYVYIGGNSSLAVLDCTDPSDMSVIATFTNSIPSDAIARRGEKIYCVGGWSNRIIIIDISDPTTPTICDSIWGDDYYFLGCINGDYLYLTGESGIDIYDISDSVPFQVSNISSYTWYDDITVSGNYLYQLNRNYEIIIYDISDPENPVLTGSCLISGWGYRLYYRNNYLYVAAEDYMDVIDVADVENPTEVSVYDCTGYGYHLDGYGDNIYLGEMSYGIVGVRYLNDSHLQENDRIDLSLAAPVKDEMNVSYGSDWITVSLISTSSGEATVEIFDSAGRRAGEHTVHTDVGNKKINISRKNYNRGVYFVKVSMNGKNITKKIYLL